MLNTPFSPWPSYTDEEAEKAKRVILSNRVNYWTGQECREFEREFASWCHCEFAVSVANGTLALNACIEALGIGQGDEVIVTSRTFLASASAIATSGAVPIFADIDRDSQNVTVETIKPLVSPRTKAIMCVHLAGWPCEMDPIVAYAAGRDLYVIEDCAQAHGAEYKGKPVGALGDVAAWSFCQDKIMTTGGEGGMVTTSDEELWKRIWSLKDHGKDWDAVYSQQHPPGFRWLHHSFGHNWRMLEVQAAIGRIQLKRMKDWTAARQANAKRILEAAESTGLFRCPHPPRHCQHAWYKGYIFVRLEALKEGWNRDRIMNAIADLGVPCYSGSCSEVYLEKAFEKAGLRPRHRLTVAKELGETSLMFLVHPTLSDDEIGRTCQAIAAIAEQAKR